MLKAVRKFFLICSGATLDVLEQPECKTELTRFAMMGAFVALTAVFAAFSGGYALYTGFKTLTLAIPAGAVWGAFIFTLDRFIISSIRKKRLDSHLSFTEKALAKLGEFATASPRLLMAGFIAITVAVPLELKYFEPEIRTHIADDNLKAAERVAGEAPKSVPEIASLEKELNDMVTAEESLTNRRDLLRDQLFAEGAGTEGQGFSGVPGEGPRFEKRRAEYNRVDEDLRNMMNGNAPRKVQIRGRLDTLRIELGDIIKRNTATKEQGDGFLARFKALRQLSTDESVRNLSLFIVILLILVEITPVLIKLFARRGPYDDVLEAAEHKVRVLKQKEISDFNSDINAELELYKVKSEARRLLEEQLIQDTLSIPSIQHLASDEVTEARTEIAKATIGDWKLRQLQRLDILS